MNAIIAENVKAIEAQIAECNDKITSYKQSEKDVKEAVKVLERTKVQFENNDVLMKISGNMIEQFDVTITELTKDGFDDKITNEKDKIKKLNKALLALQEIDN
jgi:ribosome maturation protein Sdo1